MAGPVGVDDRWTVTVDGHAFTYTAIDGDDLPKVAAGLEKAYTDFLATKSGNTVPTYTVSATGNNLSITDPNGFWITLQQRVAAAGTVTRTLTTTSTVHFTTAALVLSGTPINGETWAVLINGAATPYSYHLTESKTLDEVGTALAGLNSANAHYDAITHTLTINNLANATVGFQVAERIQPALR